jgi:hypothetical protein
MERAEIHLHEFARVLDTEERRDAPGPGVEVAVAELEAGGPSPSGAPNRTSEA